MHATVVDCARPWNSKTILCTLKIVDLRSSLPLHLAVKDYLRNILPREASDAVNSKHSLIPASFCLKRNSFNKHVLSADSLL